MKVSVVIAAYQEAGNIGPLTERLIAVLDSLESLGWELIYVIDGEDETTEIAREFARQRGEIRVLHQDEPRGLGHAFRRGFAAVAPDSDCVVTMDADLNHQPEEIPRLLDLLRAEGFDIVIGSRKLAESSVKGTPLWKRALSGLGNRSMRLLMKLPVSDRTSGFRVYRAESLRAIRFEQDGFAFLPEILLRAQALGMKMAEAPIQFVFRKDGESKMRVMATARSYLALFRMRKRFAFRPASPRDPD